MYLHLNALVLREGGDSSQAAKYSHKCNFICQIVSGANPVCICLFVLVTHVIHVVSKVQFQIVRCLWWQCCNSRCQIPLQFWARVRSDSQFRVRTNPRFPTSDCRSRLCQDCLVIGRRVGRVWGDNYKSRVKSRIWTAFLSSWLSWSWQKSWYSWYEYVTNTLCYFVLRWVC